MTEFLAQDPRGLGPGAANVLSGLFGGALFFASSSDLTTFFEYSRDPGRIVIDMSRSHIWDAPLWRPLTRS